MAKENLKIRDAIMQAPENQIYSKAGIEPLFTAPKAARLVIVGQAPGLATQEAGRPWDDRSGNRLREWLGMDRSTFYDSDFLAILPMDFYYPGKGKSGDLPPRKGFAAKWHPQILAQLPEVRLTLLVGRYAQDYYLAKSKRSNLTETVAHYQDYLPDYFPLVHPSPLNQRWLKQHPWFEQEVIPDLQKLIHTILK